MFSICVKLPPRDTCIARNACRADFKCIRTWYSGGMSIVPQRIGRSVSVVQLDKRIISVVCIQP